MPDQTANPTEPRYYKAVREKDCRDFRTGTVHYAVGTVVKHPTANAMIRNFPASYLSITTEPGESLIGGYWPCRLMRVEPIGDVLDDLDVSPHKRAVLSMRVVEELPAHLALGPMGEHVAALLDRIRRLTEEQKRLLLPVEIHSWISDWVKAWDATRDAALRSARMAARDATLNALYQAVVPVPDNKQRPMWGATAALVVRDVLPVEDYRRLTHAAAKVVGPLHPDDEEATRG